MLHLRERQAHVPAARANGAACTCALPHRTAEPLPPPTHWAAKAETLGNSGIKGSPSQVTVFNLFTSSCKVREQDPNGVCYSKADGKSYLETTLQQDN